MSDDDLNKDDMWEGPNGEYVRRIYPDESAKDDDEGEYIHGQAPDDDPRDEGENEQPQNDGDEPAADEPADEEDAEADEEEFYRCEIVANNSVQDDIVELLETACPDILYTIIPSVHGRGKNDRKLQTATWPETNFILFAYVTKERIPAVQRAVRAVKETFHGEGIKLFIMKGCLPEDL